MYCVFLIAYNFLGACSSSQIKMRANNNMLVQKKDSRNSEAEIKKLQQQLHDIKQQVGILTTLLFI